MKHIYMDNLRCGVGGCHYMCGRRMVAWLLASCPAQPSPAQPGAAWCGVTRDTQRQRRQGGEGIQIY